MSDSEKDIEEEEYHSDHDDSEFLSEKESLDSKREKYEDEDEKDNKPLKKKRKFNKFIDIEADVGDDDDEDLEEYDLEEIDDKREEAEEAAELERDFKEIDNRRSYFRSLMERDEQILDAEAEEERLRRLYGKLRADKADRDTMASIISHRALIQPQSEDPKLWLVKCKPGKERAVVASLIKHIQLLPETSCPEVFSALSRDNVKGYIYIEAYKPTEIINMIQKCKLRHAVYASPINKPSMVPISEMADILIVGNAERKKSLFKDIELGNWVRVKRGKYAGDLAQIVEIPEDPTLIDRYTNLKVKLIPRISYIVTSSGTRPLPRLFNPQEASQYGSVTKMRGFWHYNGETFKDGYLYKEMKLIALQVERIVPLQSELESFNALFDQSISSSTMQENLEFKDGGRMEKARQIEIDERLKRKNANIAMNVQNYSIGEKVYIRDEDEDEEGNYNDDNHDSSQEIIEKKKKSLATIENIVEGLVHIRLDDDSNSKLILHPSKITRFLEEGDLVHVIGNGEYSGTRGIIVQIKRNKATVFATSRQIQFDINLDFLGRIDAGMASSLSSSTGSYNRYQSGGNGKGIPSSSSSGRKDGELTVGDTVVINESNDFGLILKMGEEEGMAHVVIQDGSNKLFPLDSMRRANVESSSMSTLKYGSSSSGMGGTVRQNDRVIIDDQVGTVLQIYQSIAFVRLIDTNKIITKDALALYSMQIGHGLHSSLSSSSSSPSFSMPYSQAATSFREREGMGRERKNIINPKHILGKSVSIAGGPYKGYIGIVSQVRDGMARVELHTNSKIVSIPADRLLVHESESGDGFNKSTLSSDVGKTQLESRVTLWNNSASPSNATAMRTPAWNSTKTPAWNSTKTPAHSGMGSKTPAWNAFGGPSFGAGTSGAEKTPAWNTFSSGKTPVWSAGTGAGGGFSSGNNGPSSTLPDGGTGSGKMGIGGGSKTPSWVLPQAEGRTPAWAATTSSSGAGINSGNAANDGSKTPITRHSAKNNTSQMLTNALPSWVIPLAVVKLKLGRGLETHIVRVETTNPVNIYLAEDGGGLCVGIDEIESVPPSKKDRVRLLGTQSCGIVVGLDGPDAVIRLDGSSDFKIVALNNLVKIINS